MSASCSKLIILKFLFVEEKVVELLIIVEYTSTDNMLVNSLAKGLPCVCAFIARIPCGIVRSLYCIELVGVYTFLCMMDMLIDMDCLCFVLIHAYYGSLSLFMMFTHILCLINDNLVRDIQFLVSFCWWIHM